MIGSEFIATLGEFMAKCQRSSSAYIGSGYLELMTFSGKKPVSGFEERLEKALDEWDIPEAQKKQIITDSLRGPASEDIQNLKLSIQNFTSYDYLSIL